MFSFLKKKPSAGKEERLSGPKSIPGVVGQYIVVKLKGDPDRVWSLKAVLKPNVKSKNAFDVRVFEDSPLLSSRVKNYNSLNEHPEMILYEGWFDKKTLDAEITAKGTGG